MYIWFGLFLLKGVVINVIDKFKYRGNNNEKYFYVLRILKWKFNYIYFIDN